MMRRYLNLILIVTACGLLAAFVLILTPAKPPLDKVDPAVLAVMATPLAPSGEPTASPTSTQTAAAEARARSLLRLVGPEDETTGTPGWEFEHLYHTFVCTIRTAKQREIRVDSSGNVVGLSDAAALVPRGGTALSRKAALEAARKHAARLGLAIPSREPDSLKLWDHGESPPDRSWEVRWSHRYKGYSFKNDWTFLDLNAQTGELIGYSHNGNSSEPDTVDVRISAEEAARVAAIVVQSRSSVQVKKAKLLIVNPNYIFGAQAVPYPDRYTRLVWVIPYEKSTFDGGNVWIDAATGECVGGEPRA